MGQDPLVSDRQRQACTAVMGCCSCGVLEAATETRAGKDSFPLVSALNSLSQAWYLVLICFPPNPTLFYTTEPPVTQMSLAPADENKSSLPCFGLPFSVMVLLL